MAEHERHAAASRAGWRTRRLNQGLPPDRREPPTKPVGLYVRDVAELQQYNPDPKKAVRLLLEAVQVAVESGVVRWTGDGWELGVWRPQDAIPAPPPASTRPAPLRALWGIVDAVRGLFSK